MINQPVVIYIKIAMIVQKKIILSFNTLETLID